MSNTATAFSAKSNIGISSPFEQSRLQRPITMAQCHTRYAKERQIFRVYDKTFPAYHLHHFFLSFISGPGVFQSQQMHLCLKSEKEKEGRCIQRPLSSQSPVSLLSREGEKGQRKKDTA